LKEKAGKEESGNRKEGKKDFSLWLTEMTVFNDQ
jgi:hypothetical protein